MRKNGESMQSSSQVIVILQWGFFSDIDEPQFVPHVVITFVSQIGIFSSDLFRKKNL